MNNECCQAIRPFSTIGSVDADMDTLFRRGSSDADSNCRKMRESQRGIEEGGFESGGSG